MIRFVVCTVDFIGHSHETGKFHVLSTMRWDGRLTF